MPTQNDANYSVGHVSSVAPSHTPGPWAFISNVFPLAIIRDEPGFTKQIAVISTLDSSRETQTANARLIAAAPELLEAAKLVFAEMQEQYVPGENCDCSTDANNCEWCATYRKLEKAIAKAGGQ